MAVLDNRKGTDLVITLFRRQASREEIQSEMRILDILEPLGYDAEKMHYRSISSGNSNCDNQGGLFLDEGAHE